MFVELLLCALKADIVRIQMAPLLNFRKRFMLLSSISTNPQSFKHGGMCVSSTQYSEALLTSRS